VRELLPAAAAASLLLIVRQSGLTERVNLFAYDLAVQLRPAPSGASTAVRIIGINETDLHRYGPLVSDQLLADAVERLDRIGVRAIGLDLFCGQPVGAGGERLRRLAESEALWEALCKKLWGDACCAEVCRAHATKVLLALAPFSKPTPSAPPLRVASRESNRSLAFCFSGPWHLKQERSKRGLMSFS
jgi:CHASE2 domain-containing sensor protein